MPFSHDADPLHEPPPSSPDPARRAGPTTLTTLQRSAGNRATGRLLRQAAAITRRPVGEPGAWGSISATSRRVIKVIKVILKAISALAIDFDALTGDEHEFETFRAVGKSDFFGLGIVMHVEAGPGEIQQVGLPMDTDPPAIDLGGPQIAIGASVGTEPGVWIPLMDL
jgi:hypothetical protein